MTIDKNKSSLLIWLLAAVTCLGPLTMDIYLPAFPSVMTGLHTNATMVQFTLTAWLLGFSLGQVFAGTVSDVIGRRKPLVWSLVIFALSTVACSLATDIYLLIIFRFIGGLAASAASVVCRAVAADVYQGALLTKILSTIMIIQGIAPVVAPIIGATLLIAFPWEAIFVFLSIVITLVILLVFFNYRETLAEEKRVKGDFKNILHIFYLLSTHKEFVTLCFLQFMVYSSLFAYLSGMPFILQGIYGFTPQEFSWFFAIVGIGMMVFGKITSLMVSFVKEKTMLLGALCQGVAFALLFFLGVYLDWNVFLTLFFLFLSQVSLPMISATSFSLALAKQGQYAGSASALLGFYANIAGAMVAPLVSIAGEKTAMPTAVIIFTVEVAALLLYFYYHRISKGVNHE